MITLSKEEKVALFIALNHALRNEMDILLRDTGWDEEKLDLVIGELVAFREALKDDATEVSYGKRVSFGFLTVVARKE